MADVVALRTALTRLGFTNDAAVYITGTQGFDNLDEFKLLDDDEVTNLCKVVRRPGGTLPADDNDDADAPAVPNPGIPVSLVAENNLKLCCFYLRYKERTSRPVAAGDIERATVRALKDHKQWEEEMKEVTAPEINPRDWPKTIEAIVEWLRGCLGVTKIPLAYVIRDNVNVPAHASDPVGNYNNKRDELIARAPIRNAADDGYVATYLADRTRVWELISEITRDHDCWTFVRPAQRTRDGRLAFLGLKGHYLGVNMVDIMSSLAEKKLRTTIYTGERRRWNFEKYVKIHVDQHVILEGLVEHGYAGIDPRSKVRYLVDGIKTTKLDTIKSQILATPALRSDFDASVNLFQDFIKQVPSNKKEISIAAVGTDRGGEHGSGQVKPDMSVEDRYYKRSEYAKLSMAKKLGLKRKREARGHRSDNGKKKKKMELSEASIKALATAMSKQVQFEDDSDSEATDDDPPPKKPRSESNRTNRALQRKGKKG